MKRNLICILLVGSLVIFIFSGSKLARIVSNYNGREGEGYSWNEEKRI